MYLALALLLRAALVGVGALLFSRRTGAGRRVSGIAVQTIPELAP